VLCLYSAGSCQGHVFFTQSRYDVTVSSVTAAGHVTDLYVYTAPSSGGGRHQDDVIMCRLTNVYHTHDKKVMIADTWPFSLSPSNDDNNDDNNDRYYYNSTVSLYVRSRDVAASESRDHGLSPVATTLLAICL